MNIESGTDMQASEAVETPEKIENNAPISLDKVSNGKFDEEYKSSKNNWEFKELLDKYSYLWEPDYHFITDGSPLYVGPNGQVILTKLFIESLGLKQYVGYIDSLDYELEYKKTKS